MFKDRVKGIQMKATEKVKTLLGKDLLTRDLLPKTLFAKRGRGQAPELASSPSMPVSPSPARSRATKSDLKRAQQWFATLPPANQILLGSGSIAIVLSAMITLVPPLVSGMTAEVTSGVTAGLTDVSAVTRPYTAGGKQEICLSHLQSLAQALSLYSDDYGGHYPLEDNGGSGQARVTWVSLLRTRTDAQNLTCPLRSVSDPRVQSGYGLNPILGADSRLGAVSRKDIVHPEEVILLADRGAAHDVALLPALPGCHPAGIVSQGGVSQGISGSPPPASVADSDLCNVAFGHGNSANVLYADGHVAPLAPGSWLQDVATWGGGIALHRSLLRLETQESLLAQAQAALDTGNQKAAAALLTAHRDQTRKAFDDLLVLWKCSGSAEEERDPALDRTSWALARLGRNIEENRLLQGMDAEVSKESQSELAKVQAGGWQKEVSESDFSIERPAGWTVEAKQQGRYRRTYLRSGSPYISVMIEVGERERAAAASPIDWGGMERVLEGQLRRQYQRVRMSRGALGTETAGVWEFTVERASEPRLYKLYLGYAHPRQSFVLVCTVPAPEWSRWQPFFDRMKRTFSFSDLTSAGE